jgi:hypothetical protein
MKPSRSDAPWRRSIGWSDQQHTSHLEPVVREVRRRIHDHLPAVAVRAGDATNQEQFSR